MKLTIFLCITALMILNSCMVLFEKPQPVSSKELKEVPSELIGTYIEEDDDTLIVTKNSYHYKDRNPWGSGSQEKGTLEPGKVVLKKVDDYYVLSYKVEDIEANSAEKPWMVYIIQLKGNQLSVNYLSTEKNDSTRMVDSVKNIVSVKEIRDGDEKYYLINPSKKEFKSMIENKIFNDTLKFRKIK